MDYRHCSVAASANLLAMVVVAVQYLAVFVLATATVPRFFRALRTSLASSHCSFSSRWE